MKKERGMLLLCHLDAVKVQSSQLFAHLSPDSNLIVAKSYKHFDEDEESIHSEIQHLLRGGVVEPSKSPSSFTTGGSSP